MKSTTQLRLGQHFFGVVRTKAMLHQFSYVTLAALFIIFSGASSFGSPNRNECADGFMKSLVVGVDFSGNLGIGVEVFQKNFPSNHFGQPEFKVCNCVEKFLMAAKFDPIIRAESGRELLLRSGEVFDGHHNTNLSIWSPGSSRSGQPFWLTRKVSHIARILQLQNRPNFIIGFPA